MAYSAVEALMGLAIGPPQLYEGLGRERVGTLDTLGGEQSHDRVVLGSHGVQHAYGAVRHGSVTHGRCVGMEQRDDNIDCEAVDGTLSEYSGFG